MGGSKGGNQGGGCAARTWKQSLSDRQYSSFHPAAAFFPALLSPKQRCLSPIPDSKFPDIHYPHLKTACVKIISHHQKPLIQIIQNSFQKTLVVGAVSLIIGKRGDEKNGDIFKSSRTMGVQLLVQ